MSLNVHGRRRRHRLTAAASGVLGDAARVRSVRACSGRSVRAVWSDVAGEAGVGGAWWRRWRVAAPGATAACPHMVRGRLSEHKRIGPLGGTRGTRRLKLNRLAVRGVLGVTASHHMYRGDRLSVRVDIGPRGGTRSTSSRVGRGSERTSVAQSLGAPAGGARASCIIAERGGGV